MDADILSIQREHEERLRSCRRWIVAETESGYEVHEWSESGVAPAVTYPVAELAAARLLQLMDIHHAVRPQNWPESVCIGFAETQGGQVVEMKGKSEWK